MYNCSMAIDIDRDNASLTRVAAEILRRHDNGEAEANITSAVLDFLVMTELARRDQIVEENPRRTVRGGRWT